MNNLAAILNTMSQHAESVHDWLTANRDNSGCLAKIAEAMNPAGQPASNAERAKDIIRALDAHLFTMTTAADLIRGELLIEE